jgi:hypothetical protein
MLEDSDNLPEWVQSKITKAEDYMSTVANYMEAEMNEETEIQESGGPVVYKKGDDHIEKYGEDSFALYKDGKKAKYYTSIEAAKEAMNEEMKSVTVKHKTSGKELVVTPEKAKQLKPHGYHPVKEEVEQIDEKNVPTSPEKWAQAKAQAKAKFDVYPSAYANGWAAKKYKAMGGGWKSVSEATDPPFDKPYTTVKKVVTDKSGAKHSPMSRARDIARMAMKKQMEKMKPVKESLEESRKAEIVKEIMKKKKDKSEDAFQKDPELTTTLAKGI